MRLGRLDEKAAPWVSAAVLLGGLTSAILLFILVRIDNRVENLSYRFETVDNAVPR